MWQTFSREKKRLKERKKQKKTKEKILFFSFSEKKKKRKSQGMKKGNKRKKIKLKLKKKVEEPFKSPETFNPKIRYKNYHNRNNFILRPKHTHTQTSQILQQQQKQ